MRIRSLCRRSPLSSFCLIISLRLAISALTISASVAASCASRPCCRSLYSLVTSLAVSSLWTFISSLPSHRKPKPTDRNIPHRSLKKSHIALLLSHITQWNSATRLCLGTTSKSISHSFPCCIPLRDGTDCNSVWHVEGYHPTNLRVSCRSCSLIR